MVTERPGQGSGRTKQAACQKADGLKIGKSGAAEGSGALKQDLSVDLQPEFEVQGLGSFPAEEHPLE